MMELSLKQKIKLIVASELGFCMGVRRSIDMALEERAESDGSITILNELVHNRDVIDNLRESGIGQASSINEVPSGKLILSAHGVPPSLPKDAESLGLEVIDTTCPLVIKVHELVAKLTLQGYHILIYGDPNHTEVTGIIGHGDGHNTTVISNGDVLPDTLREPCALISQTTQNLDEFEKLSNTIRQRFPHVEIHNTICRPTRRRQQVAIDLAQRSDFVYVVGSPKSANSKRLVEITGNICGRSMLISAPDEIDAGHLEDVQTIGLTAGASSPDSLIVDVIRKLYGMFDVDLVSENERFAGLAIQDDA